MATLALSSWWEPTFIIYSFINSLNSYSLKAVLSQALCQVLGEHTRSCLSFAALLAVGCGFGDAVVEGQLEASLSLSCFLTREAV